MNKVILSAAICAASFFAFEASANCSSIGGALPSASSPTATCPSHRTQDWWIGTWATQMIDPSRGNVVSHTRLFENGNYRTSLIYSDGQRVEHWGTYSINFPDGQNSASRQVRSLRGEVMELEMRLRQVADEDSEIAVILEIGGALPSPEPITCICDEGKISYNVEGWTPSNLDFPSPQDFNFTVVEDGYVRVSGNGADEVLARRYSRS